jgi:hypothetical protein
MNTRTTYRTLPVYYYREGYDLDGVKLLHARLWDVYAQQWRLFWCYEHIPAAIRASLTQRERDTLRGKLASAPQPEVAR